MTAVGTRVYRLGEFHSFDGGGHKFLYMVPAGAIFEQDESVAALIGELSDGDLPHDELAARLIASGMDYAAAEELIVEMFDARVIVTGESLPPPLENPPADFPLQSLVMNLTNQCNLSCQYCYEFGEDKVATPEGKPKFMDLDTAKASVDFLLRSSPGRQAIGITFFGGETLMNFPLLKQVA